MTQSNPPIWRLDRHGHEVVLSLRGNWIARESGLRNRAEMRQALEPLDAVQLRFDASGLGRWDSALVVFIQSLRAEAARQVPPLGLDESALPEAARRLLALAEVGAEQEPEENAALRPSLATRVGYLVFNWWDGGVAVAALVGETALRGVAAFGGRTRTRAVDVMQLMREAGGGAVAIIAVVNGLVGAILAFVGAVQLRRFGAGIYVADLVGIAMVREMAAVMTAIVMAGRTGGAYAAHLATMQGNEEIDALRALGIPVHDFLVLPRVVALVAMMPLLYLYACAVGLFGGFVVGGAILDLAPSAFWGQIQTAVAGRQFVIGLVKSIAFGALVALVGCHVGLQAGRSAADVGRAATRAVVAGIVGIIALDAVFAVCADALGV